MMCLFQDLSADFYNILCPEIEYRIILFAYMNKIFVNKILIIISNNINCYLLLYTHE